MAPRNYEVQTEGLDLTEEQHKALVAALRGAALTQLAHLDFTDDVVVRMLPTNGGTRGVALIRKSSA